MNTYNYEYSFCCRFDPAVCCHSFKLRVEPMACACQTLLSHSVRLTPATRLNRATDGFGNSLIYGLVEAPHDRFEVAVKGVVACSDYVIGDPAPAEYYRYPTPLSQWDEVIRHWAAGRTPLQIMEAVHRRMHYERYRTDNTTTAVEAFRLGIGVCQDFAHVMLAACRSAGYLARYVNGMIEGEGETHAWVEVHHNGCWTAYDPTFNRPAQEGYIKLAHGRDTNDCAVNRGRFCNWTTELMNVKCKVTHDTDCNFT